MGKTENICENNLLPIQDNGWKDVMFGRRVKEWTPEKLESAILEYMAWTNDLPLPKDMKLSDKVGGKNGDTNEESRRLVRRPYNMKTLCARIGISNWEEFKARYCNESTEDGWRFAALCADVENYVHGNLQEGATAGIYNAKMVMGLTDVAEHVKQEVSGLSEKSDEELEAEVKRLQAQLRVEPEN